MVLLELLDQFGVGGGMLMLASGVFAVYHLRNGIALASHIATWVQAAAILALVGLAAAAGLIPGVDLSVQIATLMDWLSTAFGSIWSVVSQFLPV